jgi:hypothetical protein
MMKKSAVVVLLLLASSLCCVAQDLNRQEDSKSAKVLNSNLRNGWLFSQLQVRVPFACRPFPPT